MSLDNTTFTLTICFKITHRGAIISIKKSQFSTRKHLHASRRVLPRPRGGAPRRCPRRIGKDPARPGPECVQSRDPMRPKSGFLRIAMPSPRPRSQECRRPRAPPAQVIQLPVLPVAPPGLPAGPAAQGAGTAGLGQSSPTIRPKSWPKQRPPPRILDAKTPWSSRRRLKPPSSLRRRRRPKRPPPTTRPKTPWSSRPPPPAQERAQECRAQVIQPGPGPSARRPDLGRQRRRRSRRPSSLCRRRRPKPPPPAQAPTKCVNFKPKSL